MIELSCIPTRNVTKFRSGCCRKYSKWMKMSTPSSLWYHAKPTTLCTHCADLQNDTKQRSQDSSKLCKLIKNNYGTFIFALNMKAQTHQKHKHLDFCCLQLQTILKEKRGDNTFWDKEAFTDTQYSVCGCKINHSVFTFICFPLFLF